ncbi:MAG: short-chain dehydrogenase/reductase [Hydrocarboniphaga sp.]|nr:short-chain dehydrogenase/reductase [Hydrocarboniphaga sp.]
MSQEVDVADEARVIEAMTGAVDKMGRVDGAIANAGIMTNARSFLNLSSELYHGLLAVNQHGAMYVAREAARHMKARFDAGDPGGSIVFCASLSALTGSASRDPARAPNGACGSTSGGVCWRSSGSAPSAAGCGA